MSPSACLGSHLRTTTTLEQASPAVTGDHRGATTGCAFGPPFGVAVSSFVETRKVKTGTDVAIGV